MRRPRSSLHQRRLIAHENDADSALILPEFVSRQRLILESSAKAISEASLAFDETMARLERYDKRIARLEALKAKRMRWNAQVQFLKALDHPAKEQESHENDAVTASQVAELASAEESLRAALAVLKGEEHDDPHAPPSSSFWGIFDLLKPKEHDSLLENSIEEAAGWLYVRIDGAWRRKWFVLRTNAQVGPFMDYSTAPGAAKLGRVVLHSCDVKAIDKNNTENGKAIEKGETHKQPGAQNSGAFEFVVSHPHQHQCLLSCVNLQTRRQWVSVIGQLVREHAQAERQADADFRNKLIGQQPTDAAQPHARATMQARLAKRYAERRLHILRARSALDPVCAGPRSSS